MSKLRWNVVSWHCWRKSDALIDPTALILSSHFLQSAFSLLLSSLILEHLVDSHMLSIDVELSEVYRKWGSSVVNRFHRGAYTSTELINSTVKCIVTKRTTTDGYPWSVASA